MKRIWQKRLLSLTRTSPTYYQGTIVKENQNLKYYFFSSLADWSEIILDSETGEQIGCKTDLAAVLENERIYSTRKPPEHYVCDDFVFNEYIISHHGEWGYVCTKNNRVLWERALKGYLYTDIIKNNDKIAFGTSGYGGHFYSLNIDSGEIIFDFNTKGTSTFFCENDSFYFASRNKKSTDIYRIDFDGNVLDTVELEGIYYDTYCPISMCDQSMYIVTLVEGKEGNLTPILNRIDL